VSRTVTLARRRFIGPLAVVIVVATGALVWTGFSAVSEWERAATNVASRRAESAVNLLVSALLRDMRGAQQRVLAAVERETLPDGKAVDLLHPIASGFARYPYADAFFSWRASPTPDTVVFYARAERRPAWLAAYDGQKAFPVVVGNDPRLAKSLIARISKDAAQGRRFSIFDTTVGGTAAQVVALISYADPLHERPAAVLGFIVDLAWTRAHYFREIASQIADIEGDGVGLRMTLLDEAGRPVVGDAGAAVDSNVTAKQVLPVGFFDPATVTTGRPSDLALRTWTAAVRADADPTLAAAERGATRTFWVSMMMAAVLTGALLLAWQAGRANAALADMRADFVSAVTHELKTPIANLRALNETIASERSTMELSREYSQMGVREAVRLSRLVDNLLAYARITDVASAYDFEPVEIPAVVERSVREFSANLTHGGFSVDIDLPEKLPAVRADATALNLMLNNLMDNAIRYSSERRHLRISATTDRRTVTLVVADQGQGIAAEDIPRVTRRFARGRGSAAGGSGLGLAIVDRVVHDHGGTLRIDSVVGQGTSVAITLPVAE
jgi:signal transduction histidine kinase